MEQSFVMLDPTRNLKRKEQGAFNVQEEHGAQLEQAPVQTVP